MHSRSRLARTVLIGATATLALTAAHHVYGAIIYATPWRNHATVVAAIGCVVLWSSYRIHLHARSPRSGRIAFAVFAATAGLLAVAAIGGFEGFYNHVLKNLTFFAGMSLEQHNRMFPPPTYELPNDLLFELSGVLQVVPAAIAGIALFRLLRAERAGARPS